MADEPHHYSVDVGSIKEEHFAWVRDAGTPSNSIDDLSKALKADLQANHRITLGYECPTYWLLPEVKGQLGKARLGEGSRPYLSGAGAAVTPTGIQALAYVFLPLKQSLKPGDVVFSAVSFREGRGRLLVWEAFGSNKPGKVADCDDAACIAKTFQSWWSKGTPKPFDESPNPFSLIGAVLLWAGIETNVQLLHSPCMILPVDYTGVKFTVRERKSKSQK